MANSPLYQFEGTGSRGWEEVGPSSKDMTFLEMLDNSYVLRIMGLLSELMRYCKKQ